ncbi:nectin-2 isoform X2 [Pseudophryne corroboree]|uniref:nectin-2 isoform X2 n=1 Tax=Pseudophryne corroboree TaxID=495146 RepID=UPI003081F3EA
MQIPLFLLLGLCAVLQAQQVSVKDKLTGFIGQEVILPCTITNQDPNVHVSQIMWMKDGVNVVAYSPVLGTHPSDAAHFQLLEPSENNATLRILNVRATDEGEYVCEATTFPHGNRNAATALTVKAMPQNSAVVSSGVVAGDQEQVVATCRSANGRPPPGITWQTSLAGNVSNTVTNNSDGTSTVVSQYLTKPTWTADGMPILCIINYESTETPIPLKLSVQYPPMATVDGFDDNWHLNRKGAYLSCVGRGNPPPTSYTWKTADGSPLPSSVRAQNNILYVDEVDERVNRTFLCVVTNALGSREFRQDVFVREKPNTSGAGATGGIIGGIIAAIVGVAVVGTVIMICRQQRRNETTKDEEEFEGPPAYKPPPPSVKMQTEKFAGEEIPLKSPPQPPEITQEQQMTPPKYTEDPESWHHSTYEDDYLEQENPIYNEFAPPESGSRREENGFVMSPAVYV